MDDRTFEAGMIVDNDVEISLDMIKELSYGKGDDEEGDE